MQFESLQQEFDQLQKTIEDVLWFQRVRDVAYVDKVCIVGPPRWKEPNPTAQDVLGEHSFDRLDTKQAKEIRLKIYKFLAGYLSPPNPFRSLDDLSRAGYH